VEGKLRVLQQVLAYSKERTNRAHGKGREEGIGRKERKNSAFTKDERKQRRVAFINVRGNL